MSNLLAKPKGTKMHRFIKIVPSANLISLSSKASEIPRRIVATVGRNVYINNEPIMNPFGMQPYIRYLEKTENFNAAFKNVEKYRRASEPRLKEIKFQEQEAAEDKQKEEQTPDVVANKNFVNPRIVECQVVDMMYFDNLLDMEKRNCQTVAHPNTQNLMGKKKTVSAYKKGEKPELNFRGTCWNKITTGLETNGALGKQFAMLLPKRSYSTSTRAIKGERLLMDRINDDQMLSNLTQSCFKNYLTLSIKRKASKVSKSSNFELNSNFPLSTFFNSENRLMNIDVYKQSLIEAAKRRAALNKYKPAGVKYKNKIVVPPRVVNNQESSKNRFKKDIDFQSKADDVRKKVDDDNNVGSKANVLKRLKLNALKNYLEYIEKPINLYPLPMELKKPAENNNVVSPRVVNNEESSKNHSKKDIGFLSKADDVKKKVDDDNNVGSQANVVKSLKFILKNYLGPIKKLTNSYPLPMELKKPADNSNIVSPRVVNNEESSEDRSKKDIDFQSKAEDVRKKVDDDNNIGSQANVEKRLNFSPLKNYVGDIKIPTNPYPLPMELKEPAENSNIVSLRVVNNEESSENRSKKDIDFQSKAEDVRKKVDDDNNIGSQANVEKRLNFSPLENYVGDIKKPTNPYPLPMELKKPAENSNIVSLRVVNNEESRENRSKKDIDFQSKAEDVRKKVDDDNNVGSQANVEKRLNFSPLKNYVGHIKKPTNPYPLPMELKKPAENSNIVSLRVVNNEESSEDRSNKDIDFQSKAEDVRKKVDDDNNVGSQANVEKRLNFSPLKNYVGDIKKPTNPYPLPMQLKKPGENSNIVSLRVVNNEESSEDRSKKDIDFQSKTEDVRKKVDDDNNVGSQANVENRLNFSPLKNYALPMQLKKPAENSNVGRNLKSLVIRQPKEMETDKPTSHGQSEDHVPKPQLKPSCLNLKSSEESSYDGVGFRSNFNIVNLLRKLASTKNASPDKVVEYTLVEPRLEFYFIRLSPATLKNRSSNDSIELYSRKHMFSQRLPTISMGYVPPKVDFKHVVKSQLKPLCHYSSVGKNKDTDGLVPNLQTNLEKRNKIDANQSCITAKRDVQHESESPGQSLCHSSMLEKPKEKTDTKTEVSIVGYTSPKNCVAHILVTPQSSLLPMKLENCGHRDDVDRKLKDSVANKSEPVKPSSSNKNPDQVKTTSHNSKHSKQAEVSDKSLPYRTKLKDCTLPTDFEKKDYIHTPGRNCKNCESREGPVMYNEGYIPSDQTPKYQLEPSLPYQQPMELNRRIDDDRFMLNSENSKNNKSQVATLERDMLATTDLKHALGPGCKALCPYQLPEKPMKPIDKNKLKGASVSDSGKRSPIKFCNTTIHRKKNRGSPVTFKRRCTLYPPLLKPKKEVDDNSAIKSLKYDHVPKRKMSSLKGFTPPKTDVNNKLETSSCAPPSRCFRQSSSCSLELNREYRGMSRPQVNIFRGFNTKGNSEIDFKYVSSYRPQVTIFAKCHPTINSHEERICVIDKEQFDSDRKE